MAETSKGDKPASRPVDKPAVKAESKVVDKPVDKAAENTAPQVDPRLDNRIGDQRPVAGEVTPQQISGDPDDDTEDPAPADPIEPGTVLGHQSVGPHGRGAAATDSKD